MKTLTLGGLTSRVIGELDDGGMVVVLLHGFGAPGTDLVPLANFIECSPRTAFVFPEAPLSLEGFLGGRAWWMLDLEALEAAARGERRDRSDEKPEGLVKPSEMVRELIRGLKDEHGVDESRIVLGGFSQGAMVAIDVVLRSDAALAGLVVWSGTLLCKDEWIPLMSQRQGMPVVQSHGEADPLLPFDIAERLRDGMVAAGMAVDWVRFAGAHEIPPEVLDHTADLLRRLDRGLASSRD